MFEIIVFMVLFAIAYAIKGGQPSKIFTNWEREVSLSYKASSMFFVLIVCAATTVFYQVNIGLMPYAWQSVLVFVLAWIVAVAPSMGEEYGALLGKSYPVDANDRGIQSVKIPFIKKPVTGRKEIEYGVKKAIQRGVWMGACFTVVTGYTGFIWASLLYAPVAALCLHFAPNKIFSPWGWSEFAVGAICIGFPFGLYILKLIAG